MTESPKPLGMSDFFALEAGEYLERLDGMLAKGDSPSADEIVRLARALRGSALMANQPAIARAAAGLEVLARAVREGRRAWDPQTQQLALRAVDDLKIFVRRAGSWTDADTAKAEALAVELEQVAGRPSAQIRAVEALGLDAGARAFVAREGAAIAGALERAAQALRANPRAHEPLQHVMRALQPLRGLAALTDLPPLPDSLDRAPSATQRELRAHTLGTTFRALANAGGGVLADRVAQFAIAGREAVASGIAVSSAAAFAAELRRAGDLLVRSGTGDEEALATELDALTAALRAIQPGAAPAPARAPAAPAPAPRPAPASRPTPHPAAASALSGWKAAAAPRAVPALPETTDLVGSWAAYQGLLEAGFGSASLAELIAGVESAPAAPAPGSPLAAAAAPAAVDVRALLYRGDRALQRVNELRAAAKRASGDELRALVDEVCDLVALALEPSPYPGVRFPPPLPFGRN